MRETQAIKKLVNVIFPNNIVGVIYISYYYSISIYRYE